MEYTSEQKQQAVKAITDLVAEELNNAQRGGHTSVWSYEAAFDTFAQVVIAPLQQQIDTLKAEVSQLKSPPSQDSIS